MIGIFSWQLVLWNSKITNIMISCVHKQKAPSGEGALCSAKIFYNLLLKWRHLQDDHYPHDHPENVSYEPNKYAVQICRRLSVPTITISSDIDENP